MDDQQQQIIDYIRTQLQQGHSEDVIRQHMLNSGWTQPAIDQAFVRYYATYAPTPATKPASSSQTLAAAAVARKKWPALKWVVIGTTVLVILAIVLFLLLRSSTPAQQAVGDLGNSAEQRNAQNTSRQNDVSAIAAAIAEYINNNAGALPSLTAVDKAPNTLDICGSSCNRTNKSTVKLGYYQNNSVAVQFHDYKNGLTVPNLSAVYIVDHATCQSNGSGIGSNAGIQSRSVAILYALQGDTGTQQKCLNI